MRLCSGAAYFESMQHFGKHGAVRVERHAGAAATYPKADTAAHGGIQQRRPHVRCEEVGPGLLQLDRRVGDGREVSHASEAAIRVRCAVGGGGAFRTAWSLSPKWYQMFPAGVYGSVGPIWVTMYLRSVMRPLVYLLRCG